MAKKKTVGTSSESRTRRANAAPTPEVDDSDNRVRGKPVSLHPLSFSQALRVMIRTPPPKKRTE